MSTGPMSSPRGLPSVDSLARHPRLAPWRDAGPAPARAARHVLEAERARRREGSGLHVTVDDLAAAADAWLEERLRPGPRRVINATGVIVHTNLGRAPLSPAARVAALDAAGYCDLEYDLAGGARGSRQDHVAPLLATLCGAEDATVVTNNAAAVLLVLRALCRGREVMVSRGEAVEIGGGFRIPEVMREAGARMVDVGTTNRTRASDYAQAVTPRSSAIVRVHPSNFTIVGFAERPSTAACAAIAHDNGLLLIEDAGSGAFTDLPVLDGERGAEPMPADLIGAGADIVTASGDKLCGGPQAGLIAGRSDLIARLRRHPLMRALRPDKLVLAALGATLSSHLRGTAATEVPVVRMLCRDAAAVAADAQAWTAALREQGVPAVACAAQSQSGGGSLPGATLPTTCVTLEGRSRRLLAALRDGDPPVIARASGGRLWLDPRTVSAEEVPQLIRMVVGAWTAVTKQEGGCR
ncbi:MAG: L-seryl-tRNA(Sec) selenium transferase [Candidatus Dormibacteria bacterium]